MLPLGTPPDLMEEFYAISIERRITDPAVAAITTAARRTLFATPDAALAAGSAGSPQRKAPTVRAAARSSSAP